MEWIHRRELFLQLAHGSYMSTLQLGSVQQVLRSCVGADVTLQVTSARTLWFDVVAVALALEEGLSNARKYGDGACAIVVRTHDEARDGRVRLIVEVDSTDPDGAPRLSPKQARRAFEHGFRCTASASFLGKTPYSDGIGLPAARAAARAATGTVELLTREVDGRVHTILRLSVPARHDVSISPPEAAVPSEQARAAAAAHAPLHFWSDRAGRSPSLEARPTSLEEVRRVKEVAADGEAHGNGLHPNGPKAAAAASEGGGGAAVVPTRPVCIVVDDDDLVQEVVLMQIESLGTFEAHALGATVEEQACIEDIIMGARPELARSPDALVPALLANARAPAAVAVIDLHLSLPPPWPAHLQGQRADGKPLVPEDGIDLATRLRTRGFRGKIILHTAESLASLEEIRLSTVIDEVIEKGSALHFKQQFVKIMAEV